MRVQEYRDMISDLADTLASCKSAASFDELEKETESLRRKLEAAEEFERLRCHASRKDRAKAASVAELTRQFITSSLMAIHDNQRIEAEYLGEEYPFVNPARLGK